MLDTLVVKEKVTSRKKFVIVSFEKETKLDIKEVNTFNPFQHLLYLFTE